MPRSLADRIDHRASLSRTSVGKGSLGRFSVGTDISVSSAATRHWVNSVSDIYGPDEIDELLQDLNKLELARFDSEHLDATQYDNFDNFDIDGSKTEGLDVLGNSCPGSPLLRAPSPGALSSRSWDSHTHYQQFKDPPDDYGWGGSRGPGHIVRPLQAAVCYCDMNMLKTPRTLLRVLVLVTSVACLSSLVTSGTAKLGVSALPHFAKLRLILFVSLASALFSLLLIFLNISHLHALIPMDYSKMQTIIYLLLTVGYLSASSLVAWIIVTYNSDPNFSWIPSSTKHQLITTTVLGYICGLQTMVCSYQSHRHSHYAKIEESSTNFTLHDTVTTRAVTADTIMPPPRPQPPPPPRPQQRSHNDRGGYSLANQNYHPPPPVHHTNYSELVKQNIEHNHNGGRQVRTMRGSVSPDYPLPPVRSVSQHRIGTAEEMQNYYELRPRIPVLTEDEPPPRIVSSQSRHNNSKPRSIHKRSSSNAANNNNKSIVQIKDPTEHFDILSEPAGNGVHENNGDYSNDNSDKEDEEGDPLLVEGRKANHTSVRTKIPLSQSDVLIQYHTAHSEQEDHRPRPILNSKHHQEFHPEQNSLNPVNTLRETGAIPKRKKNAPIPSPLTIHPDEIISLPMDDLSPSLSASNSKQQRYNNYAH